MDPWQSGSLLAALLLHGSVATVAGILLVRWLAGVRSGDHSSCPVAVFDAPLALAVACGLLAALLHFLLQVGAVNQRGLSGMGDLDMAAIVLATPPGAALQWRVGGFLCLAATLLVWHRPGAVAWSAGILPLAGLSALALSYAMTGHVAPLGAAARTALTLHILAMALWVGSIWPLWRCSRAMPISETIRLMQRFGDVAGCFLLILAGTGLFLLLRLSDGLLSLPASGWGRMLMIKLVLVVGLLMLAVRHRFRLVPALRHGGETGAILRLQRSLAWEIALAVGVLGSTAVLTGLFRP